MDKTCSEKEKETISCIVDGVKYMNEERYILANFNIPLQIAL
jgi:hypothetical protein